ncbi:DNA helicase Pif1 like family-containing protein [Strongyloides ratti]|uniref:ATP-dependent DNA helicase n=1 Tax=Strongyloides ratti TaxID=34506 RepID=A0A090KUY1_STRRB|nr:DNA helicase Pif1 like family-containing protein [Strongyloides ratti]CEF61320.1 DNA helicase Pif1 like family-containing protein [Strongyloides ratti]
MVNDINKKISNKYFNQQSTLLSNDKLYFENVQQKENVNIDINKDSLKIFNSIGYPLHCLKIAKRCILICLRNLNIKEGLCNDTRIIFKEIVKTLIGLQKLLRYKSLDGKKVFLIPQIIFSLIDIKVPILFTRYQYPVKLRYYKAEIFFHGQLYVALSHVKSSKDVKIKCTYKQVLSIKVKIQISISTSFLNCNDNDLEKFTLEIPNEINCDEKLFWHQEMKQVIQLNATTKECLPVMKFLYVSRKYVIIMDKSSIINKHVLLIHSKNKFFDHPICLPTKKLYFKFNNGYFIDVRKKNYWSIEQLDDEIYDPLLLRSYTTTNLTKKAFLLGIQSQLTLNPFNYKLNQNINSDELYKSFYFITGFKLNNNEATIKRGYEFLGNVTNGIANSTFQHLCYKNNKKIKNIENGNTLEEKVRTYLKRSDVTCKSKDKFGAFEVETYAIILCPYLQNKET